MERPARIVIALAVIGGCLAAAHFILLLAAGRGWSGEALISAAGAAFALGLLAAMRTAELWRQTAMLQACPVWGCGRPATDWWLCTRLHAPRPVSGRARMLACQRHAEQLAERYDDGGPDDLRTVLRLQPREEQP